MVRFGEVRRSLGPGGPVGPSRSLELGLEHACNSLVLAVHGHDPRPTEARNRAHRPVDHSVVEPVTESGAPPHGLGVVRRNHRGEMELVAGDPVLPGVLGNLPDLLLGLQHVCDEYVRGAVRGDCAEEMIEHVVERHDVARLDELCEVRVTHPWRGRLDPPGGHAGRDGCAGFARKILQQRPVHPRMALGIHNPGNQDLPTGIECGRSGWEQLLGSDCDDPSSIHSDPRSPHSAWRHNRRARDRQINFAHRALGASTRSAQ